MTLNISKKLMMTTLVIAGLTAAPRAAGACSCTGEVPFERAVASSKQIFRGVVVDVRSAEPTYPMMVWARIAVAQYWKGTPGDTAMVLTPVNGAVCGFTFTPGADYLVYADPYLPGNDVYTHLCARTHETWAGDPDLAALDTVTPVRKHTWGALKLRFR